MDQAEIRKMETKIKKFKIMVSSSLESVEDKITRRLNDKILKIEADLSKLSGKYQTQVLENLLIYLSSVVVP